MLHTIDYDAVADLYDHYVKADFDLSFFLKEARNTKGKVLELACGTGRVSLPLLQAGVDLTCVDYSEEMLAGFRQKLERHHLTCSVINMDMSNLSLPNCYDLIFIPFHSFSEILDSTKRAKTLRGIHGCLTASGRFICTLQNPTVRTKSMDGTLKKLGRFPTETGGALVVSSLLNYEVSSQTAHGIQLYELYDKQEALVEKKQLDVRFHLFTKDEFENLSLSTGFRVVELYGEYDHSPFDEATSPFMIWVLQRSAASS